MDQDAFRNLLSAPRSSAGGSSSRGVLGAPAPKRGWGLKAKDGYEKKKEEKPTKPEFAPRKYQKREQPNPDEAQYKDRAELRRKGLKDSEFEEVSNLLEEFEKRKLKATKPEELEELEKQRAYLGGDVNHSVLVKGLDYSLLAARKAELEKLKGEEMDDELDNLGKGLGGGKGKGKGKDGEKGKVEEKEGLGKGFKSIAQKKAEEEASKGEKKKKKKKKKVKPEIEAEPSATGEPSTSKDTKPSGKDIQMEESLPTEKPKPTSKPSIPTKAPSPAPPSEDEDIFGDVGEYDLGTGAVDSDSSDDEKMDLDIKEDRDKPPSRGRSRTRSPNTKKHGGYGPRSPGYRHDRSGSRSRSMDRRRSRSRSRSRSRGYGRDRSRGYGRRSPSYDRRRSPSPHRRRSPSPDRRRNRDGSYSRSRSRSPIYRIRSRSPIRYRPRSRSRSPVRNRYRSRSYSRSRSPPRRRDEYTRRPLSISRSRSPRPRRDYSPSPRLSPPPKRQIRERSFTRSPSPLLHIAPIRSPSISSDEEEGEAVPLTTKLQPLSSSIIPSLKNFLDADNEQAKNDDKKLKKAKWRSQNGLSTQDGASDLLASSKDRDSERADKQKSNREYQLLMNKMNKGGGETKE